MDFLAPLVEVFLSFLLLCFTLALDLTSHKVCVDAAVIGQRKEIKVYHKINQEYYSGNYEDLS